MKNYLHSFDLLSDEEIDLVLRVGIEKKLGKNDFLIREGQVCKEVAFVQSGFFRSFYYNASGEETTYCFSFSGAFITAYSSLLTQEKTIENIYAMTDAVVFSIPRKEIIKLEQQSSNWLRLIKQLAEQEYLKMEQRVFLLKESAEFRYNDLLLHHPEYLQQIPLHQLASFLGITQRHLSRIRSLYRN
jgi:CRP-like cAMP-binding protein